MNEETANGEMIIINQALKILDRRLRESAAPLNDGAHVGSTVEMIEHAEISLKAETKENICIYYIDSDLKLIEFSKEFLGSDTKCTADLNYIARRAILLNAKFISIAHNHPKGDMWPSESDIRFTEKAQKAMRLLDIVVMDHIIVSGSGTLSMHSHHISPFN